MRIDKLALENFRCFPALTLDLHPEFNLIIGANGAGKSSILDAMAVALGGWLLGFLDAGKRHIQRDDMRRVVQKVGGEPGLELAGATVVDAVGSLDGKKSIRWKRTLQTPTGRTTYAEADSIRRASEAAQAAVTRGRSVDLPVLAYYGTGRLWDQKRDTAASSLVETLESRLEGYASCLERASALKHLESWMKWREEMRLEQLALAPEAPHSDPQLDAVRGAACACIEGARRFYYSFGYKELRLESSEGKVLPFHLLSDGYRNLLTMAADIAWRAVRLNPHHGAAAAQLTRGVVLIDEIDLSLHPAWQRRVIGDLRRTFPRIQFVATTHSPQVVSSAKSEWLRLLTPGGEIRRIQHGEGRDSNSLLEDIFGAPSRPVEATRQIEHLFDRIDAMDWPAAEDEWARLHAFLGPDDPDVIRARALIDLERGLDLVPTDAERARD